jgi:small subunit ribosomal protein S4e
MSKHLKRLLAPKFWKVAKKERKWVVRPRAGPHKKLESIPLLIIIRDILKLTDLGKEARKIIKAKEILVDGKPRTDTKYPAGLFDSIIISKLKKQYRIVPDKHGLSVIEIPKKESELKLCRIENKSLVRKGFLQLNLHDGKNILVKEKKSDYKTSDSLLIELPSLKINKHIKMERGATAIIIGGQNMGEVVKIKEIIEVKGKEPNKVICETKGKQFEAIKDYVFVVGKTKPEIKVVE